MGCPTIIVNFSKTEDDLILSSIFNLWASQFLIFHAKIPFELSTTLPIGLPEELGPRCKFDQNFPWALYCLGPLSQDLLGLFFGPIRPSDLFCQDLLGLVSGPKLTKAYLPLDTLYCKVSYCNIPVPLVLFCSLKYSVYPLLFTSLL